MADSESGSTPTIYDVAERAAVSIATVSNVLNRPARVARETRSKVMTAIDELAYVPRSEAVSRARRGLGRIGVVAPLTAYPSFEVRLRGVIHALGSEPFELVLYDQASLAVRSDYLASLPIGDRLDGLVVMSLPFEDAVAERLLARHLPTVLVEFSRADFDSVTIDDRRGGALAAEHLISLGHQRLGFIGEVQASEWIVAQSGQRLEGFRSALDEEGVEFDDRCVILTEPGATGGAKAIDTMMTLRDRPTAVFVHSDQQALGVIEGARRLGVSIPEDLALVGFDDLDFAGPIGLTTIAQPLEESGRRAIRLLLDRIADPTGATQRVELSTRLAARYTTTGRVEQPVI